MTLCGTHNNNNDKKKKRKEKKRLSVQLYCHYTQMQDIMKCTLASLRYGNMSSANIRTQEQKH